MRDMSLRKVLSLPATKPAEELTAGTVLYLQKDSSKRLNVSFFDETGDRPGKAIRDHRITGPETLYQSAPGVSVQGEYKIANFDSFTTYDVTISDGSVSVSGDTITVTPPVTPGKVYLTVNGEHSLITIKPPAVLPPMITYPLNGMSFIDEVEVQLSPFATSGPVDTAALTLWQVSKDPAFESGVSETITDGDDLVQVLALPTPGDTYYLRGRRIGTILGMSEWSDAVIVTARLKALLVTEHAIIAPSAPVFEGGFGSSLSFANDNASMFILSKKGLGAGNALGGAHLYAKDSNGLWNRTGSLVPSALTASDVIGQAGSVSEDGVWFVMGIPVCTAHPTGMVAVFENVSGVWTESPVLLPTDPTGISQFGYSVAINKGGTHLIVGAPGASGNSGCVYIFEREEGAWIQKAVLNPDTVVTGDYYGTSVALNASASMAIVGSIGHAPIMPNTETGCAYLYSRSESTWVLERKLYSPDATSGALFGTAVAVNDAGTEAYVSGVSRLINGVTSGSVKVYNKFYPVPWSESVELLPMEGHAGQKFGSALALNAAGTRLVIGASGDAQYGVIYVYDRDEENWTLTSKRQASIPRIGAAFGNEVEINKTGSEVYVGSRDDSEVQIHSGKVYHFK